MSAVGGIAGQAIRVSRDDSLGFTTFDSLQHFSKDWPPFSHGAFALLKDMGDTQAFLSHQLINALRLETGRAARGRG